MADHAYTKASLLKLVELAKEAEKIAYGQFLVDDAIHETFPEQVPEKQVEISRGKWCVLNILLCDAGIQPER